MCHIKVPQQLNGKYLLLKGEIVFFFLSFLADQIWEMHCCLLQVKKQKKKMHLVFENANDVHDYLHVERGREIRSQAVTHNMREDAF